MPDDSAASFFFADGTGSDFAYDTLTFFRAGISGTYEADDAVRVEYTFSGDTLRRTTTLFDDLFCCNNT